MLGKLPKTYSDFEVFNDMNNFDSKKHTIDFYHASCLSVFTGVLSCPEVYFYDHDVTNRAAKRHLMTNLEKYVSHISGVGFDKSALLGEKTQGSTSERMKKFGF